MKQRANGSTWLWRAISVSALTATCLLLFGFAYAASDLLFPSVPPAVQTDSEQEQGGGSAELTGQDEIRIVAIGDSLTRGTGDVTGEGYVKQVVDGLSAKLDKPVQLINNLAVNGLRADELADKLESERGMHLAVEQANVILLTIGGNDLFQFAQGAVFEEQQAESMNRNEISHRLSEGVQRLERVFELLHELNPEAKVVYVGLYNPFYDLQQLREGSLQVQEWNNYAYRAAYEYPNITVVPTFDLFESTIGTYLSRDHFHPNHEGYTQIAARIIQVLQ
ncbi:GDSL-type esterase/lipase family protein [Paenibacillus abyssi]|uniref:SGNH hydrolase-type esterase domain-containing protein n=1 Tax=Paenibacillus abyssi TaxID=1340531 RepID=A0A917FL59_9BACL|nr:GDSL-type esterase/lipase family protein [Paenibacillus abyssi]GGF89287.1 hypothetical protein GCM10010916_03290 [Paenibacillus abyssi]